MEFFSFEGGGNLGCKNGYEAERWRNLIHIINLRPAGIKPRFKLLSAFITITNSNFTPSL